jgi:uncharacterized damage-inducible protein DinB
MNTDYLRLLLDFHDWARDRVLEAVEALSPEQYERPLGNSFPSVRDTLNHLYNAEWVWYSRWNGVSPTSFPPGGEMPDLRTLRERWTELEGKVRTFLANCGQAELNRVIEYRLMSGTPGASPLWQMVAHLVNHGTYHRGQVTTMLRQLGVAAPRGTDMITFFREQVGTGQPMETVR